MNSSLCNQASRALLVLASLAAFAFAPLASEAKADDFVKKVKVKAVDGKAKIKHKANGKQKVKVKGPNGGLAADIAYSATGGRESYCSK